MSVDLLHLWGQMGAFAKGIVYKSYARRGWQQVGNAQPGQQAVAA